MLVNTLPATMQIDARCIPEFWNTVCCCADICSAIEFKFRISSVALLFKCHLWRMPQSLTQSFSVALDPKPLSQAQRTRSISLASCCCRSMGLPAGAGIRLPSFASSRSVQGPRSTGRVSSLAFPRQEAPAQAAGSDSAAAEGFCISALKDTAGDIYSLFFSKPRLKHSAVILPTASPPSPSSSAGGFAWQAGLKRC